MNWWLSCPRKRCLPCPAGHFQLEGSGKAVTEADSLQRQKRGGALSQQRCGLSMRGQRLCGPGPARLHRSPGHSRDSAPSQSCLYRIGPAYLASCISTPSLLCSIQPGWSSSRSESMLASVLPLGLAVPCCFLCQEYCCPRSLHGHFLVFIFFSNVTSWSWSWSPIDPTFPMPPHANHSLSPYSALFFF